MGSPSSPTAFTTSLSALLDGQQSAACRDHALTLLFEHASLSLLRFVRARSSDPVAADDIVADTWEGIVHFVQQGRYEDRGCDPLHFVYAFARFVLKKHFSQEVQRRHHETPLLHDSSLYVDTSSLDILEDQCDLDQQITHLLPNDEEQQVLRLLLAEYSLPEIADTLQCSYKTVWRRYHRLLSTCRDALSASS